MDPATGTAADNPAGAEPGPGHEERHRLLDRKIMRGSSWVAVSYGGRQIISFGSTLVLVRLLDPKAFGLVALAFAALFVLQAVQDSGLGSALIHRRENLEEATATVFVFSLATGLGIYAVAFAVAPLVANAFHSPELTGVLRALSLLMPIHALGTVPSSLLEREVRFRPRTISDIGGALAQAVTAISLALAGAGVWALIAGQLASQAVSTGLLWTLAPWRPALRLASVRMLRQLMRYGRFITGSNLLLVASSSIDNVIVAQLLNATLLGFYSVAFRLTELPVIVIGTIVGRVMFPIYSMVREDVATVRRAYVHNLQRVALLSLPISIGMAVAGEPLVRALLGARWLPSVHTLQVLAVYALVRAMAAPAGELFKGMGKPHYNLVIGILYLAIATPLIWVLTSVYGMVGAALGVLIAATLLNVVTFTLVFRLVRLSPRDLFTALAPFLLTAGLVAAGIEPVVRATRAVPSAASLAAVIAVGAVVCAAGTALFARDVVLQMWHSLGLRRSRSDVEAVSI